LGKKGLPVALPAQPQEKNAKPFRPVTNKCCLIVIVHINNQLENRRKTTWEEIDRESQNGTEHE
jgi:hypothetical protein